MNEGPRWLRIIKYGDNKFLDSVPLIRFASESQLSCWVCWGFHCQEEKKFEHYLVYLFYFPY